MFKHIVLMKLRDDVPYETIEDIFIGIHDLKQELLGIMSFSYGKNISAQGLNQGFTHGFSMDFVDPEYSQLFLEHPKHTEILEKIKQSLVSEGDILVFDYPLDIKV